MSAFNLPLISTMSDTYQWRLESHVDNVLQSNLRHKERVAFDLLDMEASDNECARTATSDGGHLERRLPSEFRSPQQ